MNRLHNILLCLFVMVASNTGYCADKVIERSEKKLPEWIKQYPEEYLVVEIERPDMEQAMRDAETEISRRIVSAIALNVAHSAASEAEESFDGYTVTLNEHFSSQTEITAAYLPFLTGISLSKAKATYWERREDADSKGVYVSLAVLYPFPDSERRALTEKFEAIDKESNDEYARLEKQLKDVSCEGEIQVAEGKLESLERFFADRIRKENVRSLHDRYRKLYKSIMITGELDCGQKVLACRLELDGRTFDSSAKPKLTSNCATRLSAEKSSLGCVYSVTYSDDDCLDWEDNWIEVAFRFPGATLKKKFYINTKNK